MNAAEVHAASSGDILIVAMDERAIANAKDAYRSIIMSGMMERRFLYATLLAFDVPPFAHLEFRPVV